MMSLIMVGILLASKQSIHHTKHPSILAAKPNSMVLQNQEIDRLKLPRIVDDSQLHQLEQSGELVRIPENEKLAVSPVVKEDRRYVRPWTSLMVMDIANAFYNVFSIPLIVDSAVRTVEQQQRLRRVNRYAAPEVGLAPSSHLAGITIDLAKRRYSSKQRRWIVNYLKNLQDRGLAIVAEEPACYHVASLEVYQSGK